MRATQQKLRTPVAEAGVFVKSPDAALLCIANRFDVQETDVKARSELKEWRKSCAALVTLAAQESFPTL